MRFSNVLGRYASLCEVLAVTSFCWLSGPVASLSAGYRWHRFVIPQRLLRSGLVVVVVAQCLVVSTAEGYSGEWNASVGAGALGGGALTLGGAALVSGSYGASESVELQLDAGVSLHPESDSDRTDTVLLRLLPGASFKVDVVSWVPHVGAAGGLFGAFGEDSELGFGFEVFTGLDYLLTRSWAVGAQYRFGVLLSDVYDQPLHSGLLRLEYSPGW